MTLRRRQFLGRIAELGSSALVAPSLAGLAAWNHATPAEARIAAAGRDRLLQAFGYGPLTPSRDAPELEIPANFRCVRISQALRPAVGHPDLQVPNAFDGMAAFRLPNGHVRLIRNHEMTDGAATARPIGSPYYDAKADGGTTSLEVRIKGQGADRTVEVVDEFVSLAGTRVNCAGGPTPWGSWLSCEENCFGPTQGFDRPHGYVFEVPASATSAVAPVPLRAMGRFVHEAVAVDPATGIVYQTEDAWYNPEHTDHQPGAGCYRFRPRRRGRLAEGGRLQIMAVKGRPKYVTVRGQRAGASLTVGWIDLEDVDPAAAETDPSALLREGLSKGAAIFARLEGAWAADGGIYLVSTNGGDARAGQVFFYRPTSTDAGQLTLVFESPSREVLDAPDNICATPRGGLLMCEDGGGDQYVRGLDRQGRIIDLVRHRHHLGQAAPGEFAGACLSPDGEVLFFNVQGSSTAAGTVASVSYALWGPWRSGPL
jgi:secreted PhoX family phosphatase